MVQLRKKPVTIVGVQFVLDNQLRPYFSGHPEWLEAALGDPDDNPGPVVVVDAGQDSYFEVQTPEGVMKGRVNDWLFRGVEGELYPCTDSVRRATYDIV